MDVPIGGGVKSRGVRDGGEGPLKFVVGTAHGLARAHAPR